jgi:hypothetical protein
LGWFIGRRPVRVIQGVRQRVHGPPLPHGPPVQGQPSLLSGGWGFGGLGVWGGGVLGRIESLRSVVTCICEGPPQQKRALQAGSLVRHYCFSLVFCMLTSFSTFWMRSVCKKNKTCDRLHQYDLERMPHCRFFMSGCLEPACIYQVLLPAARAYPCCKLRPPTCKR